MRKIEISADVMARIIACDHGSRTNMRCHVDWPELQLTKEQVRENGIALLKGKPEPHDDPSLIELVFWR